MKDRISVLMDGELDDRSAAQVIDALAGRSEAGGKPAMPGAPITSSAMRSARAACSRRASASGSRRRSPPSPRCSPPGASAAPASRGAGSRSPPAVAAVVARGLARVRPPAAGRAGGQGSRAGRSQGSEAGVGRAAERHQRLPARPPGRSPRDVARGHGTLHPHGLRAGARGAAVRTRACGRRWSLATSVAQAQSPETLGWLRKMHQATQRLSYVGTFVYQNADRTETVAHHPLRGRGRREARGAGRRAARDRADERQDALLLAGREVVKVDRRVDRDFPGAASRAVAAMARHYDIRARRDATHRGLRLPGRRAAAEGRPALRLAPLRRSAERHASAGRTLDAPGQPVEHVHVHGA